MSTLGLVKAYGLHWDAEEVAWFPGQGRRIELLGHIGQNRGTRRLADFRRQRGLYVLHDAYGVSYVGLTTKQDLALRLRQHQRDHLRDTWSRFSWFGFCKVLVESDGDGVHQVSNYSENVSVKRSTMIRDLEAMLMAVLGPRNNRAITRFAESERWNQVRQDDYARFDLD